LCEDSAAGAGVDVPFVDVAILFLYANAKRENQKLKEKDVKV
jgi:hypothetical protein